MKKRILVVLLIATMIAGLVACGPSDAGTGDTPASQGAEASAQPAESGGDGEAAAPADGDGIKIGVSFATLQEERWQTDLGIMEAKAKELGVEIVSQSANGDENWAAPNLCTKYRVSGGGIVKVSYTAYTML